MAGNLAEEARRRGKFRGIVAVAATEASAGDQQRIHGASHADIAETAFFFQPLAVVDRARVRKQTLFHSRQEDQRKLQAFGGVQRHQRDARLWIVLVGVADQGGMIEKFCQRFASFVERPVRR